MANIQRQANLWHLAILALISVITHRVHATPPITASAMAPEGTLVVLGSQAGIEVRLWPGLQIISSLDTTLPSIHDLEFSPDGNTLLVAGGSPAEVGAVEVWAWSERKKIQRIDCHQDTIHAVGWSPDGAHWASASADGTCRVFVASTRTPVVRFGGHSRAVLSIRYLDAQTIASAGVDQTIRIWDSRRGAHLRTLENHLDTVNDLAVRPDEAKAAPVVMASISEDRTVRLWQPLIGRLVRFAQLPSTPRTVAWAHDGRRLLVGCNDGRLRVLSAESMETIAECAGLQGRMQELQMDLKLKRVLIAGEDGCRCIDLAANTPLRSGS